VPAEARKDIRLDAPAPAGANVGQRGGTSATQPAGPAQSVALPAALADFGLALLRAQSAVQGHAQTNAVVSPLSGASVLGLLHAGVSDANGREIAGVLSPRAAGSAVFTQLMPAFLDQLQAEPGSQAVPPLQMANRAWFSQKVAAQVPSVFAKVAHERFNASALSLDFSAPEAARAQINHWVKEQTRSGVPQLIPGRVITPDTRVVLTNAVYFKNPWAQPFAASATRDMPFHLGNNAEVKVPTMVSQRKLLALQDGAWTVYELAFQDERFALRIAIPVGHTLNAAETLLTGEDFVRWGKSLSPTSCKLELPRFSVAAQALSLKAALKDLGVHEVWGPGADFTPMMGARGKGVALSEVIHAAAIEIDEKGGEATAATAAVAAMKSLTPAAGVCAVNQPFLFAVVHRPSGAPLFIGKMANPAQGKGQSQSDLTKSAASRQSIAGEAEKPDSASPRAPATAVPSSQ
jgi:serpin B